jgi:hypothetical protein
MTKAEHVRLVSWRLKILRHAADEDRTVAHTCRYFGISRKTDYSSKRAAAQEIGGGLITIDHKPEGANELTPLKDWLAALDDFRNWLVREAA